MLVVGKIKKKGISLLIEYKLMSMAPYIKSDKENLELIKEVNDYFKDNYMYGRFIYKNFKVVGAYFIKDRVLELIYVERKYRYGGIGTKIMKKLKGKIDIIRVCKGNDKALRFFKNNGYEIKERDMKNVYLKRVDIDDN